ncbi:MAG: hypothetical protein ACFWT4_18740 [Citrobacter braakii]
MPVAHHQRFVADKQVAEFVFIGLQLVKRSPDIGIGINRAFQLNHRHRQAVDIANDIGTTNLFYPLNSYLIHDHKAVIARMVKIHQQRFIVNRFVFTLVLNGYAVEQQVMEGFIADDQIRAFGVGNTQYHLFQHRNREMGIDGLQLLQHYRAQKHIME